MLLKRMQVFTQIVGSITLILLALYGLLGLLEGYGPTSWAAQQIRKVSGSTEKAPLQQWGDSTVPLIMNYNGYADDHEGKAFTGYYTMTFRIYDDVIGTTTLWQEEHVNVTLRSGHFSVLLGYNTPLTNTLFTHPDRFIGVTVDPYDEMVPRERFGSMPYAMHSYHATKADDADHADHALQADRATQADHAHALSAPDGDPQDALIVDADGKIGIGTTIPSGSLDVNGQICMGGDCRSSWPSDSTMIEGWPDAIVCVGSVSGKTIYYITHAPEIHNNKYTYRFQHGTDVRNFLFNEDGTFHSKSGNHGTTDCDNKSISQLYTERKAFNFTGN